MFNKLVAGYICHFYDGQSKKIYVNTINSFANGSFSNSVMKDEWLNDQEIPAARRAPTKNNAEANVLYRSLSLILRNLLVGKIRGKTYKFYLETDLAEIPLFMKESYKANMPVFAKFFTLLIKKCEMLKHFCGLNTTQPGMAVRQRSILDRVILGANSMLGCIREVLEEMADDPVYLETHKDSIKDYEGLNGMKPMMPMSSILYYLQNDPDVANAAHSLQSLGSNEFKLMYGTRGVLNND